MKKSDKRKRKLDGMKDTTKIRWAAKGKTTYAKNDAGLDDITRPIGFEVEQWGFYFKHEETNEATFLTDEDLDYLGRRDTKPTGQSDQDAALAYCLFKCLTDSDGSTYTMKHANHSWFIRYAVEMGFDASEAQVVLNDGNRWLTIKTLCSVMASSAGIADLPLQDLSPIIPTAHRMEEVKTIPFSQLMINRMSKHLETRFRDIDKD